jgi:hypothetical protein
LRKLELSFPLYPKQLAVLNSRATEILFGGAAGPGKSHLLRIAAIVWCLAIPGLQVYLFRRTRPDLWKNHMEGPSGFLSLLAPLVSAGQCKINLSDGRIELGKSRIHLCHCEHEQDVYKYQGAEIHVLLPDELTHFSATQYAFLRSRVRMIGLDVPPNLAGRFPRIVAGTNPGNVGHNWVKAAFIDPAPPMELRRMDKTEGGMLRQFIPAFHTDNPALLRDDPEYVDRLHGLGSEALVRAMLNGDWNIVAGGALDDVWKPARQVVKPFPIPKDWRIDRSFDWGSSKPFSVAWWAESNGETVEMPDGRRVTFPRGSLIQVAELYGWNGKPNEGCRKIAAEIAREIVAFEAASPYKGRVAPGPADSAIFAVENGTSIADDMARAGVRWIAAEKGPGSRILGLERVRQYLKATLASPMESPGLFFFDTCSHSLRTLPTLPRDAKKPDDVDTDAEDHFFDSCRYRVMADARRGGSTSTASLLGV